MSVMWHVPAKMICAGALTEAFVVILKRKKKMQETKFFVVVDHESEQRV